MFPDVWTEMTKSMLQGSQAVNEAVLASFHAEGTQSDRAPDRDSGVSDQQDWTVERAVEAPDAIAVGDTVTVSTVLDADDVQAVARIPGDHRRQRDADAEAIHFVGRLRNDTLAAGVIGAALARLPGPPTALSRELTFLAPLRFGERVRGTVDVVEALGDDRYRLSTAIRSPTRDTTLVDGEAVVVLADPSEP